MPLRALGSALAITVAAASAFAGCKGNAANDLPDAATSPQASAVPAPLATTAATANNGPLATTFDAGPPPEALRGDRPVTPDAPSERPQSGYTMEASFHPVDFAPPPRTPEVNPALEDPLRKEGEPKVTIDFTANRLRFRLASGAFPLPSGTEIRARTDRYGHVLLAADGAHYGVLPPDTLHALFDDRRLDVGPTLGTETSARDGAGRRLGIVTHRVEVVTGAGRAIVEFGHLDNSGEAGLLLTRLLLELIDAPPSAVIALPDEVPLRVELHVAPRGQLIFEATSLVRHPELTSADLATPPPAAEFTPTPLPDLPSALFVSKEDLTPLRPANVDIPDAGNGFGLSLFNATERLRFAAIDGIPVAWLAPGARINVPAPRGHWFIQWRTFFGDEVSSAEPVNIPSVRTIGDADAGLSRAP